MSSPDPTTFLAILVIALVLLVWWRITLLVAGTALVTVLIFGLNEVGDRIDLQSTAETVTGSSTGPPPGHGGNVPGP